jgi:hypothetical protein
VIRAHLFLSSGIPNFLTADMNAFVQLMLPATVNTNVVVRGTANFIPLFLGADTQFAVVIVSEDDTGPLDIQRAAVSFKGNAL